jgi:hypothetical protein
MEVREPRRQEKVQCRRSRADTGRPENSRIQGRPAPAGDRRANGESRDATPSSGVALLCGGSAPVTASAGLARSGPTARVVTVAVRTGCFAARGKSRERLAVRSRGLAGGSAVGLGPLRLVLGFAPRSERGLAVGLRRQDPRRGRQRRGRRARAGFGVPPGSGWVGAGRSRLGAQSGRGIGSEMATASGNG